MSGQSIQDRIQAARHSIAGQGLAKAVCKATTEEVMGPKKKHLDYLIQCTNEPNVSIPQLANLLIERTQHANWVVVFKTLVTIHNLMNYGNERFTQYLASNNCTLSLSQFLDKTGVQGYDMSTYIRRYAKYINEKAMSYRAMAFDYCKVKRGKDDGLLRTMEADKLLKSLPILQQQLDALLEFDVTANELVNGVVNACFMILFKDLIRLFACYNDGIINLLEKFFDMNKKSATQAFDVYKKFLVRMDRCSEFLRVAESVGIDKGDIPDLAKAPSSLLQALEEHLKSMDGGKKPKDKTKVTAAIQQLQSPTSPTAGGGGISEEDKKRILDEEKAQLEQLKEQAIRNKAQSPTGAAPPLAANNPFGQDAAEAPAGATGGVEDLFGAPAPATQVAGYGYDQDLLGLGIGGDNPFGAPAVADNNPFGAPSASPWGPPASTGTHLTGSASATGGSAPPGGFEDLDFSAPPSSSTTGFDAFGDLLKPQNKSKGPPMASMASPSKQADNKIVKGDLDSSLANLAGNLAINGPASATKGGMQWDQKSTGGEKKMTGGSTWAGPTPFSTAASQQSTAPMVGRPFNNGMNASTPQFSMAPVSHHQAFYPQAPTQQAYVNNGASGPWSSSMGVPYQMATGFQQHRQPMMQSTAPMFPQQQGGNTQTTNTVNDPFGAL